MSIGYTQIYKTKKLTIQGKTFKLITNKNKIIA